MQNLLKIKEAAQYLAISVSTLRHWDKIGKLIARRTLGGHRRYTIEQIEEVHNNSKKED